jgi:photosystem II stability/assembly factor-like uncharacterized protein
VVKPGLFVNALALDPVQPEIVYAGTYKGGVVRSTDGGKSWRAVNAGLKEKGYVLALTIDQARPENVYAGGESGVFRSTNGGGSWSPLNRGLRGHSVHALAVDPGSVTVYAGTYGGGVVGYVGGE